MNSGGIFADSQISVGTRSGTNDALTCPTLKIRSISWATTTTKTHKKRRILFKPHTQTSKLVFHFSYFREHRDLHHFLLLLRDRHHFWSAVFFLTKNAAWGARSLLFTVFLCLESKVAVHSKENCCFRVRNYTQMTFTVRKQRQEWNYFTTAQIRSDRGVCDDDDR